MKHVVDSSAWLEYFADGPNAEVFAPVIEAPDGLLIPVVTLFEVFKRVVQQRNEHMALALRGTHAAGNRSGYGCYLGTGGGEPEYAP